MHPNTETVLERRRLRRSLSRWRAAGIGAVALAIGAFALGSKGLGELAGRHQIARIAIEGTISEDRDQLEMIRKIRDDKAVEGVIVFVNSPGGTTTGGEALYGALRDLADKKPVVAQFGTIAASAGYIVGLSADHIVSRGNTITGSVGVLAQWPEVSDLLEKLGVKFNEVKSGVLKAAPSPFAPMTDDARKVMEDTIQDGFRWFLALVKERRGIDPESIAGLKDGRIFSGREALDHKLVDEIGGEAEARKWLEEVKGVKKDLEIENWEPEDARGWGLMSSGSSAAGSLAVAGINGLARVLTKDSAVGLDGLVSVWHP